MVPMIKALTRAISQLSDPAVSRVVWRSIVGAILGFLTLAGLVWILLFQTRLTDYPWLDNTIDVLGGLAVFGLAYLFFPAVVVSDLRPAAGSGGQRGGAAVLSGSSARPRPEPLDRDLRLPCASWSSWSPSTSWFCPPT